MTAPTNQLLKASSPYLLQHAHNPVAWHEWGPEALERARIENKPLLISIGYAACHWCHVMAHESFEDSTVAAFMNEHFINIKIDREERPDIDQIYMNAVQLITGQGGWPLNAFALPDGRPFYAGTYFPKENWMSVLSQLVQVYTNDHDKVVEQAEAITEGIRQNELELVSNTDQLSFSKTKYSGFYRSYDQLIDFELGGFKRAPKFALPIGWEFLLQYASLKHNSRALEAVEKTLIEMAKGGIYDQLGGGFARYSVDANWKVPHFEKMLYDNGQLMSLYAHAYQLTKNPLYERVIRSTLSFVERELFDPIGGFYSSLDADSEGEEGIFYVWTLSELEEVLSENELELVKKFYQIKATGNWEQGKNILYSKQTAEQYAAEQQMNPALFMGSLEEAHGKLLKARSKRVRPGTDDKVLSSWNAIMLKGYIDCFKAIGDEHFLVMAIQNAEFLHQKMMLDDGSLFRNFKNGTASIPGFLDDYACVAQAFIELYQVSFDKKWLDLADQLISYVLLHFSDEQTGLFFYTSDESESLIARKHEVSDNVIPASNSVIAHVLLRLGMYFDHEVYTERAQLMLHQVERQIMQGGPYFANWEMLYGLVSHGIFEVAIIGPNASEFQTEINQHYHPNSLILGGSDENLPLLKNKLIKGKTMIYVCQNQVCKLPVSTVEEALSQL